MLGRYSRLWSLNNNSVNELLLKTKQQLILKDAQSSYYILVLYDI
jgi:hypothetical protein